MSACLTVHHLSMNTSSSSTSRKVVDCFHAVCCEAGKILVLLQKAFKCLTTIIGFIQCYQNVLECFTPQCRAHACVTSKSAQPDLTDKILILLCIIAAQSFGWSFFFWSSRALTGCMNSIAR
eukprot:TRINITY_DN25442_c0_g1_i1.p3 TRINITY_DN25442_c0_g1~~TRINITY_DN25442_c0_g1_i1.p3  ORF type:complete len:122 (+),score=14.51 TRINITY_DN25442_c0_g1_i1:132-497(+)